MIQLTFSLFTQGKLDWLTARANEFATLVNVVLALVPIVPIAAKQTTTIKANITAYSTAVGPSSEIKNRRTRNM